MDNNLGLIKYREGVISVRNNEKDGRVWVADRELGETVFQPGSSMDVQVTEGSHEVVIVPGGRRKVARRKRQDGDAPVIDIKNLRVKSALKDCDYITVEIYRDRIVVKGQKRESTRRIEHLQQTPRVPLTSFTFFDTDHKAVRAGFESAGFLVEKDANVRYSVPLEQFDASLLPPAMTWFVNLEKVSTKDRHCAHLIRLFAQASSACRPSLVALSSREGTEVLGAFLESEGFAQTSLPAGAVYSAFGVVPFSSKSPYQGVRDHLSEMVRITPKDIPFTAVSFYSGCLSDLGFKNANFKVLKAYDLSKDLADAMGERDFPNPEMSYKNNIGDEFTGADINALSPDDIPEADCYFFSPPCQGFSKTNRKTGFVGNPKNANMLTAIRIIQAKEPKVFGIEQVPDMLTVADGVFKEEIRDALGGMYDLSFHVVNCAEIGSPQARKRAIVLGSRIGPAEAVFPAVTSPKTVKEAFASITADLFNQEDISANRQDTVERMKHVPQGGNWRDIPLHLRTNAMGGGATHSSIYKRLHPEQPSITMTNTRKSSVIHPYEDRGLSIREIARLMDLPDLYEFVGTLAEKQQQLANGIPLNLSQSVAENLKRCLTTHALQEDVKPDTEQVA